MSETRIQCPKCHKTSGDDWKQCRGSCPMLMSPHFKKDPMTDILSALDGMAQVEATQNPPSPVAARAAAKIRALAEAVGQAASWFDEYADHHAEKGADEKAQRNRDRANWLGAVIKAEVFDQ